VSQPSTINVYFLTLCCARSVPERPERPEQLQTAAYREWLQQLIRTSEKRVRLQRVQPPLFGSIDQEVGLQRQESARENGALGNFVFIEVGEVRDCQH
jgi:hypothetical protein